ncbi:hypothetical protein CDD83_5621 [Cordyceps sp. RAO-2017]|nr:hypothetical protein CDD83_5621 [Cordyceps sp. RAO-2017]
MAAPFLVSSNTSNRPSGLRKLKGAYNALEDFRGTHARSAVCHLHGVVRDATGVASMLFAWIEKKDILSKAMAEESSDQLRSRWASQISESLAKLHEHGIFWGDAKAENVLIDQDEMLELLTLEGFTLRVGLTRRRPGHYIDGDEQGLAKILDILRF